MLGFRDLSLLTLVLVGCCAAYEDNDAAIREKRSHYVGGCDQRCGDLAHCENGRCVCNSGCGGNPLSGCHYTVVHKVTHHCGILAHWDSFRLTCICNTACGGNPFVACHVLIVAQPPLRHLPRGISSSSSSSSGSHSHSGSHSDSHSGSKSKRKKHGSSSGGRSSRSSGSHSHSHSGSKSKRRKHGSSSGGRSSRSAGDSDERFD